MANTWSDFLGDIVHGWNKPFIDVALTGLNRELGATFKSGAQFLKQEVAPGVLKYPAIAAGTAGALALFTPGGRQVAASIIGGVGSRIAQVPVALTETELSSKLSKYGGLNGESTNTKAVTSRVRRKASPKPSKARKAASYSRRRQAKKSSREVNAKVSKKKVASKKHK